MSVVVYVGLGSNLGESQDTLVNASRAIDQLPDTNLIALSSLYSSKPLAGMDQPDYVNAVAKLRTSLSADALLDGLQGIENAFGRVRKQRWGSRTLDLDILVYGNEIIDTDRLTVPHPGMTERDFVLVPLEELQPDLQVPGLGAIETLRAQCEIRGLQKLI